MTNEPTSAWRVVALAAWRALFDPMPFVPVAIGLGLLLQWLGWEAVGGPLIFVGIVLFFICFNQHLEQMSDDLASVFKGVGVILITLAIGYVVVSGLIDGSFPAKCSARFTPEDC